MINFYFYLEVEKEEKKEIDLEKEVNTLLQEIQSWKTSEFLYSKKEKFLLKTVSLQGKLLFEKSLTLCKLEIKIQRLIHLIRRNVHQDLDPFKASLMNKCLELEKRENNRLKKKKKKSFQTLTWSLRNGLIEFEDSKISKISESETASEKDLSSGEIDICESCPEEEEKEVLAEKKVIKAEHRVQPKTVQDLKKEKLVLIEDPKTPLSIPLRWSNFSI